MRVAAIQTTAGPDRGENLERAGHLVEEAADGGARLVVLPEYFSVAGSPDHLRSDAEALDGPTRTWAAALARRKGVRLHTHLAETKDEDDFCRERFGCSPVDYMDGLGWLGPDVWLAHAVHLDGAAVAKVASTGTGVAHCPSSNARLGAGIARAHDLREAGVPVSLGVDGAASNEASSLLEEVRHALLFARARGGPTELAVRDA